YLSCEQQKRAKGAFGYRLNIKSMGLRPEILIKPPPMATAESKLISILILNNRTDAIVQLLEYLSIDCFECQQTGNSSHALSKLQNEAFDFLILGDELSFSESFLMIDLASEIMFRGNIIMLTKDAGENEIVNALLKGSDEVFVKPYNLPLISARLKNLYHKRNNFYKSHRQHFGEIEMSQEEYRVWVNKQALHLTRAEFELLKFFMANPDQIIPHEVLATQVLKHNNDDDIPFDFLYSHIKNLKRKLARYSAINYIKAVYGEGYRFKGNVE
ncbi:MAG: response regulator transcription factor, partial [Bacteroidetes bacterium]|nr:response regulator transcription factor [Bacteroidota bacterium]